MASIILIAVTVAVSIALAAWMGVFDKRGEFRITGMIYVMKENDRRIAFSVQNTRNSSVTIDEIWINNFQQTDTEPGLPLTVGIDKEMTLEINCPWASGRDYRVELISSTGERFDYTTIAPEPDLETPD